ncbi:MAG: M14 family metallopeptidase [Hyphomonadaceae bacterium]
MLTERFDRVPHGLVELEVRDIERVFPRPSLIALAGAGDPLFLSVLLHGNETTSFEVLCELVRRYGGEAWPRAALIFIGNVRAAGAGVRYLEGQPDFNRIWRGEGPGANLAREVIDAAREANVFASIDIHNNTGANPHYGCINSLRPADLQLAAMFAPIGVLYQNPLTTQSMAFSQFCPAITVECGRNGDRAGVVRAVRLVEDVMRLEAFAVHAPQSEALSLFETVGRVVIHPDISFCFGESGAELLLRPDLEGFNFCEAPEGVQWGASASPQALRVLNEHGDDITDQFFRRDAGAFVLRRAVTPAMISTNCEAVRLDCLCYLMKRRPH